MNTSYDAWAKFDVEQELERVDVRAQQEEQERQKRGQAQAKRRVEDSIAQASEADAEVLAARAAVAALKAKRKGHGRSKVTADAPMAAEKAVAGPETRGDGGEDVAEVERLKRQAEVLKRKHELLKTITTSRRDGEAVLETDEGNSKCDDALEKFEAALEATKALEAMLPALEQEQQDKGGEPPMSTEKQHTKSKQEPHGHDHHHNGAKCDHKCSRNQKRSEPATKPPPLPQPTDLKAVVDMFYKDIYLGIGHCHTGAKRFAMASEAFKEVLVRDGSHLRAWMLRGRAFEAMDASLLALLHFNRVTTLAPSHEEGTKALEETKRKIFDEEAGSTTFNPAITESKSSQELLGAIAETFQQGNVIMVEGFYAYAVYKFKAVLHMLEAVKQRQVSTTCITPTASPEMLRQLEVAASMNIASASLEMQRDYGVAISFCDRVLKLEPDNAVCHFRMGQLLRVSHKYDKALVHLERAQQLCGRAATAVAAFAEAIAKELDKTQFDRGQYDFEYIRAAASSEKQQTS